MRKILSALTLATFLFSCGDEGGGGLGSVTLSGSVLASKVKGIKVCVQNTNNCAVTDSDGRYQLSVSSLPVTLELKIGNLTLGDVTVNSTSTADTTITPYDIAEGDNQTAEAIGAFLHALVGDTSQTRTVVDLSNISISNSTNLENILKNNQTFTVTVNGTNIQCSKSGTTYGGQLVSYNLQSVVNQEQQSSSSRTITLQGRAYDADLDNGTVYFYKVKDDGTLEQIETAEITNGAYSLELDPDELENDARYIIKVDGYRNGKNVKFFSVVGTGGFIQNKAFQNPNATLTDNEVPELVVSNISTADYIYLKLKFGGANKIKPEELTKALAKLKVLDLEGRMAVAGAIKAYLDFNATLHNSTWTFKDFIAEVVEKVRDDGKLSDTELNSIFNSTQDIEKYSLAVNQIRNDNTLKKVLVQSSLDYSSQALSSLINGTTYYWKPDEMAPFYEEFTFLSNGSINATHHYYNGTGWIVSPPDFQRNFQRWWISSNKVFVENSANVTYSFSVLSDDQKAIAGILTLEDDANIDWYSPATKLYSSRTFNSINDFVSAFSGCDSNSLGNFTQCLLGAFKLSNGNVYVVIPALIPGGQPQTVKVGSYNIDDSQDLLKVHISPPKFERINQSGTSKAQDLKITFVFKRVENPPNDVSKWSDDPADSGPPVQLQTGHVLYYDIPEYYKLVLYKRESDAQKVKADPFSMFFESSGQNFEETICRELIGDEELTLVNTDNGSEVIKVWCENNEIKLKFSQDGGTNYGNEFDFNGENGTLTSCPMFSGVNTCFASVEYPALRVCRQLGGQQGNQLGNQLGGQQGNQMSCKFFISQDFDDKLNEF